MAPAPTKTHQISVKIQVFLETLNFKLLVDVNWLFVIRKGHVKVSFKERNNSDKNNNNNNRFVLFLLIFFFWNH